MTADQPTREVLGPCPDPETMAAYLDNRLDAPARSAVEAHLADCEACYELVIDAAQTEEEAFETPAGRVLPMRSGRSRWIVVSAGGLAAAAALLLVVRMQPDWRQGLWQSPAERRMAALVEAVGEQRLVEGRLTGGFKYGPLRSPSRGNAATENLSLLAAAGTLQKAVAADPSPENLHAWGIAQVLLGDYDEAIRSLEESALAQPTNASLQNDIAAAYMARAQQLNRFDDWPKALEASEKALDIDSKLADAYFNRAATLEALGRRDEAIGAWSEYLSRESDSGWRSEANRRLSSLRSQSNQRNR